MIHTKTPWTYEFEERGGYDCCSDAFRILNAEGQEIAVLDLKRFGQESAWEDPPNVEAKQIGERYAAFICRAANSHERMKEALESARARIVSDWKSEFQCRGDPDEPRDDETLKLIDAALAAAKGE